MNFNHYAVIPLSIMKVDIPDGAKLLYGVLSSATDQDGNCFVTNTEITTVFNISVRNVSRWIDELAKNGLIDVTNLQGKRCIRGIDKNVHPDKNVYGQKCPPLTKMSIDKNVHPRQKCPPISNDNQEVIKNEAKNEKNDTHTIVYNNNNINNTNSSSVSEKKKKNSAAAARFLFKETKYVTELNGKEIFKAEIIAADESLKDADFNYWYMKALNWSNERNGRYVDWISSIIVWMLKEPKSKNILSQSKTTTNGTGSAAITDWSKYS